MSFARAKLTRFNDKSARPSTAATTGVRHTTSSQKSLIPKFRSLSQPPSVQSINECRQVIDNGKSLSARKSTIDESEVLNGDHSVKSDEFKDCLDIKIETIPSTEKLETPVETNSSVIVEIKNRPTSKKEKPQLVEKEKLQHVVKGKPQLVPQPVEKEKPQHVVKGKPQHVEKGKSQHVEKEKSQSIEKEESQNIEKEKPQLVEKEKESSVVKKDGLLCRRNSSSGIPICCGKTKNSPKPSPRFSQTTGIPRKATSSNLTCLSENRNTLSLTNKRNLEQFITKKKRLELLKKDIIEKQKPIFDLYQTLQQLKKKLDESGKTVTLESIKIVEFDELVAKLKQSPDLSAGGEALLRKVDLDPNVLTSMKNIIKEIPQNMLNLCRNLVEKQNFLLGTLDKSMDSTVDKNEIKLEIDKIKTDSNDLNGCLQKTCEDQEKSIDNLVNKWSQLLEVEKDLSIEKAKELQLKLKKQETQVKDLTSELQKTKQQLKDKFPADQAVLDEENKKLLEKMNILEKQVDTERKKYQHEVEKLKIVESNVKSYKAKAKDYDNSKQHYETKISQLSHDLRTAQLKIKQMEKGFEKEITELNRARHLDKTTIERLNKDHSTFETRMQTANEESESMKLAFEERECSLLKELEAAKNEAEVSRNEVGQLKKECELLQREVRSLEHQARQTADFMIRKKDNVENKLETDRECELQIEVVAQRAAIRALQEKVEANTTEKLRFIETIEKMNGKPEDMNDSIVKALVKKEDEISRYEHLLKKNEELIAKQKLEINNLYAKQENLSQQIESLSLSEDSEELKHMLKEGKTKLEQALMKSLENEHKIIKYEHELSQKTQVITNLENIMKVRDGLMSVIKSKKDELVMENHSLNKYSEEIRSYVLKAKEELKEKTEIIHELQSAMDTKQKETHRMEKRVRELEEKLSMTNEKRYKLQDTISFMEKELQATKAQMHQIEDMQTRYDLGRISDNSEVKQIGLQPWNFESALLYKSYKTAYERQMAQKSNINAMIRKNIVPPYTMSKLNDGKDDLPCRLNRNSATVLSTKISYTQKNIFADVSNSRCENVFTPNEYHQYVRNTVKNIPVVHDIPSFRGEPQNEILGGGQEYKPIIFSGIDRYKVSNNGSLLWCQPSPEMRINNTMITKDLIAHSCSKIKSNLDASLKLINESRIRK